MPFTCLALDGSAPERIQEAIKLQLGEDHLDTHMSCLLEDTGGHACGSVACSYGGPKGKKMEVQEYKDRRSNPKPRVEPRPLALAAKRQAPRRKTSKRKVKKGRRK